MRVAGSRVRPRLRLRDAIDGPWLERRAQLRRRRVRVRGIGDRAHDRDPRARPRPTTAATFDASIPPIAKNGTGAKAAAKRTSSRPTAGRPGFVGRRVHRAHADVVGVGRCVDLVGEVRRLPDDRSVARERSRLGHAPCRPALRDSRPRRPPARGRARSLRISRAPASSQRWRATAAAASSSSSDASLSRSCTMSTPPSSAGASTSSSVRPPGRAVADEVQHGAAEAGAAICGGGHGFIVATPSRDGPSTAIRPSSMDAYGSPRARAERASRRPSTADPDHAGEARCNAAGPNRNF